MHPVLTFPSIGCKENTSLPLEVRVALRNLGSPALCALAVSCYPRYADMIYIAAARNSCLATLKELATVVGPGHAAAQYIAGRGAEVSLAAGVV